MKKVAVVTSTRAEYGLLMPVIKALRSYEDENLRVELIVSGTHLSAEYGGTVSEIEADGIRIDITIPVSVSCRSAMDISGNQAEVLRCFTELFEVKKYHAVLILGDRYESLAIAIAAGNTGTPVFHLCGGDTTEGAIDEWNRHSITKMSYIHFVTNETSRQRVIQLGENPERVFNYGSTSIDNIVRIADLSKEEALLSIGMSYCKYALCTYHPVTMENDGVDVRVREFLEAICCFPEIEFIVTKSNADQGGSRINELLDCAALKVKNLHVFASLGVKRYLSLMRHAEFVLGNSSSGIIETPAFHKPTVNIGDRQRGRLQVKSIINCGEDKESIRKAICVAMSEETREICGNTESPYGDGKAAERIAKKTLEVIRSGQIDLKKQFYDISFEVK